jgi:hypothetical protein
MMKTILKTATILFLASMMAISFVPTARAIPAFRTASDPSDPAIYLSAESIYVGRTVTVSGVGFTASATIKLTWCNESIQTIPDPLVADSSGAFTALLLTNKLPEGRCTITAADGKTTAQEPLNINYHDHDQNPPGVCFDTRNSADGSCCATAHGLDNCCADALGLDIPCGAPVAPSPPSLDWAWFQVAGWQVRFN